MNTSEVKALNSQAFLSIRNISKSEQEPTVLFICELFCFARSFKINNKPRLYRKQKGIPFTTQLCQSFFLYIPKLRQNWMIRGA